MEERDRAILVSLDLDKRKDINYSMEELKNLASASNIDTIAIVTQRADKVNNKYYLGKGKLQEVKDLLKDDEDALVIFNDELSPSQLRNIEEFLERGVLDRTLLILNIFMEGAKTKEAILQVELANLNYSLPRLVGLRASLGRQGGGSGLKNRGAGETKLELDRRKIESKISFLNKELTHVVEQRKIQRKKRTENSSKIVALVGYTNAGKSTVMNQILLQSQGNLDKTVFAKDMLFATLETSVRKVELEDRRSFLLTDTVGFIDRLPHHLIKAFRSTLEELKEADLLVEIIDFSNPFYLEQKRITEETLAAIGVFNVPIIYAYNKCDLVDPEKIPLNNLAEGRVYIKAREENGVKALVDLISQELFKDYIHCTLKIPYAMAEIVAYFEHNSKVLKKEYEEDGALISVECRKEDFLRFRKYSLVSN